MDMSELTKSVGQRIRNFRNQYSWSQERLGELSGCHPTYIGQVERGEKNITIDTLDKIARALNVPLAQLLEKIGQTDASESIPLACYELVAAKSAQEQAQLYQILQEVARYREL